MRASKIAYVAVALVIALVAVIGCGKTQSRTAGKREAQTPRAAKAAPSVTERPVSKPEPAVPKVSPAETAISAAAKRNRYVFVTFYRKGDDASKSMQAALKPVRGKLSHRTDFVSVDVDDPAQQEVVSRYGADRSPIPLTLVIAPNGAITAGYPNEVKKSDFSSAFVSNGMASVLRILQDQKLAVVCIQNSRTSHSRESLAAARGLASAQGFAGGTEIVRINPADSREVKLLRQLQVSANPSEAQVIVIAPPGKVAGKFSGAVSTETMVASVSQACGPGGSCGPSG